MRTKVAPSFLIVENQENLTNKKLEHVYSQGYLLVTYVYITLNFLDIILEIAFYYTVQGDLELSIIQTQPPKCWVYKGSLPDPDQ